MYIFRSLANDPVSANIGSNKKLAGLGVYQCIEWYILQWVEKLDQVIFHELIGSSIMCIKNDLWAQGKASLTIWRFYLLSGMEDVRVPRTTDKFKPAYTKTKPITK